MHRVHSVDPPTALYLLVHRQPPLLGALHQVVPERLGAIGGIPYRDDTLSQQLFSEQQRPARTPTHSAVHSSATTPPPHTLTCVVGIAVLFSFSSFSPPRNLHPRRLLTAIAMDMKGSVTAEQTPAHIRANDLKDQALESLTKFPENANLLRKLATYIVDREH